MEVEFLSMSSDQIIPNSGTNTNSLNEQLGTKNMRHSEGAFQSNIVYNKYVHNYNKYVHDSHDYRMNFSRFVSRFWIWICF